MSELETCQLSIIFPNWNGAKDTLDYLRSIRESSYPQERIEVIMVDSHSEDNSVGQVRKEFPKVKIIELDKNYGPAYARNRGIEQARGEFIFCSDNDQTLATNTLRILANYLIANRLQSKTNGPQMGEEVGVVGAKVLSKTKPHSIISCGYRFNYWLGLESGLKNCEQIKECDWVAGCSIMFRKTLIDEIGLFDENFFFFAEDADFCLRTKKAGYKVISLPNAVVHHPLSKNKLLTKDKYYDYYKAKFRLILKHSTTLQKIISITLHMTIFSIVRYVTGKEENVILKVRALLEALRSIEQ